MLFRSCVCVCVYPCPGSEPFSSHLSHRGSTPSSCGCLFAFMIFFSNLWLDCSRSLIHQVIWQEASKVMNPQLSPAALGVSIIKAFSPVFSLHLFISPFLQSLHPSIPPSPAQAAQAVCLFLIRGAEMTQSVGCSIGHVVWVHWPCLPLRSLCD